ncbi:hypothetical protein RI367_007983 [Sorochytrium milnesiophthora]
MKQTITTAGAKKMTIDPQTRPPDKGSVASKQRKVARTDEAVAARDKDNDVSMMGETTTPTPSQRSRPEARERSSSPVRKAVAVAQPLGSQLRTEVEMANDTQSQETTDDADIDTENNVINIRPSRSERHWVQVTIAGDQDVPVPPTIRQLSAAAAAFGTVVAVRHSKERTFMIAYAKKSSAQKANAGVIKVNEQDCTLEESDGPLVNDPKTVKVTDLGPRDGPQDLKAHLRVFGEVANVYVNKDSDRRWAKVTFTTEEAATEALWQGHAIVNGFNARIWPLNANVAQLIKAKEHRQLILANLPTGLRDYDLLPLESLGATVAMIHRSRRTGTPFRMATVTFASEEDADYVINSKKQVRMRGLTAVWHRLKDKPCFACGHTDHQLKDCGQRKIVLNQQQQSSGTSSNAPTATRMQPVSTTASKNKRKMTPAPWTRDKLNEFPPLPGTNAPATPHSSPNAVAAMIDAAVAEKTKIMTAQFAEMTSALMQQMQNMQQQVQQFQVAMLQQIQHVFGQLMVPAMHAAPASWSATVVPGPMPSAPTSLVPAAIPQPPSRTSVESSTEHQTNDQRCFQNAPQAPVQYVGVAPQPLTGVHYSPSTTIVSPDMPQSGGHGSPSDCRVAGH